MKIFLWVILLIFCQKNYAYVVGGGQFSLGVSKDKDEENFGISGSYGLQSIVSKYQGYLNSQFQLGSDRGRSVTNTANHEFQFEQSFIQSFAGLKYQFSIPYFSWQNQLTHRIEFKQNNDEEGFVDTNFKDQGKSWVVSSGPSFAYNRSRWFTFQSSILASEQKRDKEKNSEMNISISIGKSISKISSFYILGSEVCSKSSNELIKDECRNDLSGSFRTIRKDLILEAEYGYSKIKDSKESIYEFNASYRVSTATDLEFHVYKSVNTLSEIDETEADLELSETATLREGGSVNFRHGFGRKRIDLRARVIKSISGIDVSKSTDAFFFYGYQLSPATCRACELEAGFEYSESDDSRYQKKTSISLKRNNTKRVSTSVSFQKTEINEEINTWSVNFLLTYNGLLTKIGER